MLRRHDRDRLFRHVDTQAGQLLVDIGKMLLHECDGLVADVEMDIVETELLDFRVIGARDDVARSQFHAFGIVKLHEALAGTGIDQVPAFTAHRLGNQEVLDLQIVEAGRVELHHFHVRNTRTRSPGHGDAVTGRAARRSAEQIGASRTAAGHHRGPCRQGLDTACLVVQRIDAPDILATVRLHHMAINDQIDRDHVGFQRDIGIGFCGFLKRFLHRPARRIVDMDDAPMAVSAFTGEVQRLLFLVERHAHPGKAFNRCRCIFDNEFNGFPAIQAGACNHRVVDVVLERVTGVEHGGDSALRPGCRAAGKVALR